MNTNIPIEDRIIEDRYLILSEYKLPNHKTCSYIIYNKNSQQLGEIKWYGPWRKYCFFPNSDTIWDNKCIASILNYLNIINLNYKENRKKD